MTAPDLIGLFIEPLERTGMRYMVTGGVASVIYGDPRFTRDVGVVLDLPAESVPRLVVRKLQYFMASESDRHLRDIASMMHISGDLIDDAAMSRWVEELGLAEAYARVRRFDVHS